MKYKVYCNNKYTCPKKIHVDGKIWNFLGNSGKWVKAVIVASLQVLPSLHFSLFIFACHCFCY